nr:signal peptidase [Bradyrhizobium japonicum]
MSVEKMTRPPPSGRAALGRATGATRPAIVAAVFIAKGALAEPFYVPSGSMEPTLLTRDALLASKFPYGYGTSSLPIQINLPESGPCSRRRRTQGDVVVFRWPGDRSQAWVKRVVGLPGDRIQMRRASSSSMTGPPSSSPTAVAAEDDNGGSEPAYRYVETLPNGVSHLIFKMRDNGPLDNTPEVTVPAGHLFVLGDNRDNSADSRVPLRSGGVGLLPIDNLVGRADAVLGSWDLGMRGQPVWTCAATGFRLARFFTAVH